MIDDTIDEIKLLQKVTSNGYSLSMYMDEEIAEALVGKMKERNINDVTHQLDDCRVFIESWSKQAMTE